MYQLKQPEDQIQKAVCDYLKTQYKNVPFYAVPNGYKKSKFEQWKSKVTGLVSGIPDLMIAKVTPEFGGLYLELKSEKGKLQETQKVQIEKLRNAGYKVEIAYSFDEAKKYIDAYLK